MKNYPVKKNQELEVDILDLPMKEMGSLKSMATYYLLKTPCQMNVP